MGDRKPHAHGRSGYADTHTIGNHAGWGHCSKRNMVIGIPATIGEQKATLSKEPGRSAWGRTIGGGCQRGSGGEYTSLTNIYEVEFGEGHLSLHPMGKREGLVGRGEFCGNVRIAIGQSVAQIVLGVPFGPLYLLTP